MSVNSNLQLEKIVLGTTDAQIAEIAHCACPDGFDLVSNGECRGKLKTMDIFWDTWMATTITECAAIQAQPIIIHNEEVSLL